MKNIDSLRKGYDKLSPRERLAALTAAGLRGDDQESAALLQSAPIVGYNVKHHYFLAMCFDDLAMIYMTLQLGAGISLFFGESGLRILEEDMTDPKKEAEAQQRADTILDLLRDLAGQILTRAAGWETFCSELAIDGRKFLEHIPGGETERGSSLELVLEYAQLLHPGELDPAEVEQRAAEYRQALDKYA